ncbi:putative effector protein [Golovinomyces cichoracearum]|uniref:Putative effector protein n=1 Tax=Golovinomyces cichoracearum TaxID=62708 RepID=A0A420IMW2_9PEZI|nr:putative effector protein [Golovinomyces cichoracearum]
MASQKITTKLILNNANPPSAPSICDPDFLLVLIESLNPHLQYPIEYTNDPIHDTHHLISQLDSLTKDIFHKTYLYHICDPPSPRNLSKPSSPFVFREFISCPKSCPQLIEAHINTRELPESCIPRPFARRVAADLYNHVKKYCNAPLNQGWQIETYHRVYSEDLGILPNWAIDAVWVWQMVSAVDWSKAVPIQKSFLLMYYSSTGYKTKEMPTAGA